jgi:hypothetical protein
MFGEPKWTRDQLSRKSEELALVERMVLLGLTVLLALAAAISPFVGVHWTVSAGSGVAAGLSALGARWRK